MATILLVDDSKTLLKHIKRMLIDGGHQVIAVSTGQAAVEQLGTTYFDLVLTDLYMPPPDGFDIVTAARALRQPPPLIVMSTNTLACNIFRDARALGAIAALEKPFTSDQLLQAIRDVLSGKITELGQQVEATPAATVAVAV